MNIHLLHHEIFVEKLSELRKQIDAATALEGKMNLEIPSVEFTSASEVPKGEYGGRRLMSERTKQCLEGVMKMNPGEINHIDIKNKVAPELQKATQKAYLNSLGTVRDKLKDQLTIRIFQRYPDIFVKRVL